MMRAFDHHPHRQIDQGYMGQQSLGLIRQGYLGPQSSGLKDQSYMGQQSPGHDILDY